ncbi:MAG: FliI/YscN family ATPase [Myxococcales bacterium]|nr:FliI/YscN family ATPase [Myxococcales bacterium]MCB9707459.1 FliI/YscN family ATPase [Myxococcales bacterium]
MDLSRYRRKLESPEGLHVQGKVARTAGPALCAIMPDVRLGDSVEVLRQDGTSLLCEVVAFGEESATLMPLGSTLGVGPGDVVQSTGQPLRIRCGQALLGRVLDGLGEPIDGKGPITGESWDVMRPPPAPLSRARLSQLLPTGIRSIDALLSLGHGQRIGVFAGSGAGKSTLLGQIARQAQTDISVVCLVGERGREIREFIEDILGKEGHARSVVVCASSDAPALVRLKSAYVATSIAEWFREQGRQVTLLMDSVTRFARAAREVGLAAGEPPARRGYPPSVFAALPALLERTGNAETGSITAFYTVLVEGGDMDEPIADEVRAILDGHIVLDRQIGIRGRYPAIDVLHSLSRVMDRLVSDDHRVNAQRLRESLMVYETHRDMVVLGAYKPGHNLLLDDALHRIEAIEAFLRQSPVEHSEFRDTIARLATLVPSARG